ncbi:MAG: hypothetical protein V4688_07445 [Pseudomonadota bacterium]
MMSSLLLARIKELLDTLMAETRPLPSERSRLDFSYRLNSDAFILHKHARAMDTETLVTHPVLKVVHAEEPEGWMLYQVDAEGHWQPHENMVFTRELADVMTSARLMAGVSQSPVSFGMAG